MKNPSIKHFFITRVILHFSTAGSEAVHKHQTIFPSDSLASNQTFLSTRKGEYTISNNRYEARSEQTQSLNKVTETIEATKS